jgi:iron complex outermembrane receptor protein
VRPCSLVLLASLVAGPLTALAQEPPIVLPEVVVPGLLEQGYVVKEATSATKTDTPLIETPQSVSVVTRDRMDDQAVNTLVEALRHSAGVQSEPFGFDPRFTTIQIRGFDASDTGLYRDGLQIRNPAFAVSFSLEPWGVERIEILRGPASIMYGAGSPAAS